MLCLNSSSILVQRRRIAPVEPDIIESGAGFELVHSLILDSERLSGWNSEVLEVAPAEVQLKKPPQGWFV